MYRILDAQGEPTGADPFELAPLDIQGAAQSQFNAIRTEAEALISSEFDSPEAACRSRGSGAGQRPALPAARRMIE